MRIDLFDVTPSSDHPAEKPRPATYAEMRVYLMDLAERAGLTVTEDCSVSPEGMTVGQRLKEGRWIDGKSVPPEYSDGAYCVPMPGYGRQHVVTCDILADDGTVARSIRLPVDKRGCVPMDKAQAKDWTGLTPTRARKAPAAKVITVPSVEPVASPLERIEAPKYRGKAAAWVELREYAEGWRFAWGYPPLSAREGGASWPFDYHGPYASRGAAVAAAGSRIKAQIGAGEFDAWMRAVWPWACDLASAPVEMPAPAPVEPLERVSADPAPIGPAAASDDLAARVAALEAALERLTAKPVASPPAAANDDALAPVRAPRAVRERLVRAYLRVREQRGLASRALDVVNQMNDDLRAERDAAIVDRDQWREGFEAATQRADTAVIDRDAAAAKIELMASEAATARRTVANAVDRLNAMGEAMQNAHQRADRLARIAIEQRRRAKRLESDLAGSRAESAAHARRASHARAELASIRPPVAPTAPAAPAPQPLYNTTMARAFTDARL